MFQLIGGAVVLGFATYGFICWWRKTYDGRRTADEPRNEFGERGHADGH